MQMKQNVEPVNETTFEEVRTAMRKVNNAGYTAAGPSGVPFIAVSRGVQRSHTPS